VYDVYGFATTFAIFSFNGAGAKHAYAAPYQLDTTGTKTYSATLDRTTVIVYGNTNIQIVRQGSTVYIRGGYSQRAGGTQMSCVEYDGYVESATTITLTDAGGGVSGMRIVKKV
jgi:hypothetical protein